MIVQRSIRAAGKLVVAQQYFSFLSSIGSVTQTGRLQNHDLDSSGDDEVFDERCSQWQPFKIT